MTTKSTGGSEPLHLLIAHGIAYLAVALLFVGWLAPPAAVVAATLAVVGGCCCEAFLASRRVRWAILFSAGLVTLVAGLLASAGVEHFAFVARSCGMPLALEISFALSFGLGALGSVVALRSLTRRWPTMGAAEAALLIGLAVWPFAAHRDFRLHQPRFLGDWALAHAFDPSLLLTCLGVIAMVAIAILRIRKLNFRQTSASLLLLLTCATIVVACPDMSPWPTHEPNGGDGPGPHPTPNPPPDDPDRPKRLTPSFKGHDWDQNPRPLAIVTLREDCGPPILGAGYYYRNFAYSDFLNRRFWQAEDLQVDADVPRKFSAETMLVPDVPATSADGLVPMTVSLIVPQRVPLCLVSPVRIEPRENANPEKFERTYTVVSWIPRREGAELLRLKAGNPQWSAARRQYYLQASPDPRFAALAEQIVGKINRTVLDESCRNSPLIDALAMRDWIQEHCTYSLHPSKPVNDDPAAEFLFGDRRGFCAHVAQSMALLLRSRGIPTRLAAGFLVPEERRGQGSAMLLQANDAHCWCEIYLEGAGWIPFDVALKKSEEPPPPGVDPGLQQFYGEENRKLHHTWSLAIGFQFAVSVVVTILFFVLGCLYLVKAWRRLAPRWATETQLYRVCYRAVLDSLADVGLSRQFGECREDFARRIAALVPEFTALSEAHLHQWLSDRPVLARAQWMQLQCSSQARLMTVIPRTRRILVWLNPVGWLLAR